MYSDIVEVSIPKRRGTIPIYYETKDKRITDYLQKNIEYHNTHACLTENINGSPQDAEAPHKTSGGAFDWEAPSMKFLRPFCLYLAIFSAFAWMASVWATGG